jgi:hypothetical protein
MKFTNRLRLPEVFLKAILNDDYNKGGADYSATQLTKPVQSVILFNRYGDEITKDISDMMWLLFGKGIHKVLESAGLKNAIQEERLSEFIAARTLSGSADLYSVDGEGIHVISDYKATSVWTAIYGSRTKEWTEQLNIYAWLYRMAGFDVDKLEVVALYRDWSDTESMRYGDRYPERAEKFVLELWPMEKTEAFIIERLNALTAAEGTPDDKLPACTDEEMWAKKDSWAVVKEGNQKATKVCYSPEDAETAKNDLEAPKPGKKKPGKYEVQFRRGGRTRCERFCDACMYCSQFMRFKAEMPDAAPGA